MTRTTVLLLAISLVATAQACRRTSDGYEVDPAAQRQAEEAAEAAEEAARRAAAKVQESAEVAGERLGDEADRAAEVLGEKGREAAGKLETAAEDLGERLQSEAREAAARAQPVIERKVDDAAVTARVKAKLLADPEVRTLAIDVDTVDGVVTLEGTVPNEAARAEALKHARQTEGVREVVDRVRVGTASAPR